MTESLRRKANQKVERFGTLSLQQFSKRIANPHWSGFCYVFGTRVFVRSQTFRNKIKVWSNKGITCVLCGLQGTFIAVEKRDPESCTIFSLYGITETQEEVLITLDHLVPKSKGGDDSIENLYPMCYDCNQEKADTRIEYLEKKLKNRN